MQRLIDQLERESTLSREEFAVLIDGHKTLGLADYLFARASKVRQQVYGKEVFLRGLIEISNYCRNNCFYCGIRCGNKDVERYRLTKKQILSCCRLGHKLGFRTFVLQGGEDTYFTDERLEDLLLSINAAYPDCAITLSLGERSKESYRRLFAAGADRYLLRHETANADHYNSLHPASMSLRNRLQCLYDLKEIGYQVGCGFMVGSPGQTTECLVEDLFLIQELQPQMVGIGPFIPHQDTPFASCVAGGLELTLFLLGLLRLMSPKILLPATTALGTIHPQGREMGILAGANVVMPNLSPQEVRGKYLLYDDKICIGDKAEESRYHIQASMHGIGYEVVTSRGDHIAFGQHTKTGGHDK